MDRSGRPRRDLRSQARLEIEPVVGLEDLMESFNLATLNERLAERLPDRECLVFGERRLTYATVAERSRRLADYLRQQGLGETGNRAELSGWSSGQDHVALYLMNGNEYIEGMLGAFKSRTVPINVNYRYVEEELTYLLRDARARAVIFHGRFAEQLAKVLPQVPDLKVLIQVEDETGAPLLPGAISYEEALAAGSPAPLTGEWSPDDLYALYTGGTTGMPKGVLWRQHDIFMAAMGGRRQDGTGFVQSVDEVLEMAANGGMRVLAAPPFMHGAGHWLAFITLHGGGTLLIQNVVDRLDPHDILATIEREKVNLIVIVGDAFGRPILDAIEEGDYDLSSLFVVANGGAPLSVTVKEALLEKLPHVLIMDGIGSSETGQQGMHTSSRDSGVATGQFTPVPDTCVVDEKLQTRLEPGSSEVGWFAKGGNVPLGYLDDEAKTRKTFPEIDGVRYAVPGDRARHLADGSVEVLGRDSVTINSGGEKIFAEEVEQALLAHPAVYDVIVAGRKSLRWGQEVVAVVQLKKGVETSPESLLEECGRHIARYKLPKDFIFAEAIQRSPSGKADYRWAKSLVEVP
jgi:acyl-CoA synthetase (AMP-forming)/AMP-acid ligase II